MGDWRKPQIRGHRVAAEVLEDKTRSLERERERAPSEEKSKKKKGELWGFAEKKAGEETKKTKRNETKGVRL